jgi:HSP20 family molecular chaperone IbpA
LPVSPSEFDITVQENTLLVTGKAHKEEEKKNGNGYLHRGIARRRSNGASASPIT